MKKVIVYLPDKTHEGLRYLANGKHKSVSWLIGRAVRFVYGEDIEDIRDA
jgi:hypothetical protein